LNITLISYIRRLYMNTGRITCRGGGEHPEEFKFEPTYTSIFTRFSQL